MLVYLPVRLSYSFVFATFGCKVTAFFQYMQIYFAFETDLEIIAAFSVLLPHR